MIQDEFYTTQKSDPHGTQIKFIRPIIVQIVIYEM